jgi:hypothetical protein
LGDLLQIKLDGIGARMASRLENSGPQLAGGPIDIRVALAYDIEQFMRIFFAKKWGALPAIIKFTGGIVEGTNLPNHLGSGLGVRDKRNQDGQP